MSYIDECIEIMRKNGRPLDKKEFDEILKKKLIEFTEQLTKAVISDKDDIPLLAAAHTILGKALCETLESKDKELYDIVLAKTRTVTIMKGVDKNEV